MTVLLHPVNALWPKPGAGLVAYHTQLGLSGTKQSSPWGRPWLAWLPSFYNSSDITLNRCFGLEQAV